MITHIKKHLNLITIIYRNRKKKNTSIKSIDLSKDLQIEDYVRIPKKCHIRENVKIGKGTYLSPNTIIESNVSIGRFCSLAPNIFIAPGEHYTELKTTHPVLFDPLWRSILGIEEKDEYIKTIGKQSAHTNIGSDVWIGLNAIIMRGVTIGDGAIIAAGAVVTKNVPPYAIVGGVPAKIIRYRFNEKTVEQLTKEEWWNHDLDIDKMYNFKNKTRK